LGTLSAGYIPISNEVGKLRVTVASQELDGVGRHIAGWVSETERERGSIQGSTNTLFSAMTVFGSKNRFRLTAPRHFLQSRDGLTARD
jgi:hypothetical protein